MLKNLKLLLELNRRSGQSTLIAELAKEGKAKIAINREDIRKTTAFKELDKSCFINVSHNDFPKGQRPIPLLADTSLLMDIAEVGSYLSDEKEKLEKVILNKDKDIRYLNYDIDRKKLEIRELSNEVSRKNKEIEKLKFNAKISITIIFAIIAIYSIIIATL